MAGVGAEEKLFWLHFFTQPMSIRKNFFTQPCRNLYVFTQHKENKENHNYWRKIWRDCNNNSSSDDFTAWCYWHFGWWNINILFYFIKPLLNIKHFMKICLLEPEEVKFSFTQPLMNFIYLSIFSSAPTLARNIMTDPFCLKQRKNKY